MLSSRKVQNNKCGRRDLNNIRANIILQYNNNIILQEVAVYIRFM